jgi:hypothetical protein
VREARAASELDRTSRPAMPRKPKPKKPSFAERLTESVDTAAGLSRALVNEPKTFPGEVAKLARRWFRKLWNARGGGLYACGFIVTLVGLEVRTFVMEIWNATGVGSYVAGQLFQVVFRFSQQSLMNTINAFIWPARVLEAFHGYGFVALVAGALVFRRYLQPPLTRWLFHDDAAEPAPNVASSPE